jgi:DNA-binding transcriptional ArsR family regulator
LSKHDSNQSVVKEAEMAEQTQESPTQERAARTEVEIEASPEQVWEALVTEQGRETWLQEPDREVHVEVVQAPSRLVCRRNRVRARLPDLAARDELRAGARLSDELGQVFAALSDPTRRAMIEALLREGTTSVPRLTAELPITRQAVAKHLATLDHAGLVERAPASGREVRYRLRDGALLSASAWLTETEAAWEGRLARLKGAVERRR